MKNLAKLTAIISFIATAAYAQPKMGGEHRMPQGGSAPHMEHQADKGEMRGDRKEMRGDRQEMRGDRQEMRGDRKEMMEVKNTL